MKTTFQIILLSLLSSSIASAAILYNSSGVAYTENFDAPAGVSASGSFTWTDNITLPGWYSENAAAGINSQFPGGISSTQVLYSFRNTETDVGAGSGRGFGTRTLNAGTFSYAFGITNNTGSTLTQADVDFVSAIWRTPSNNTSDSLTVGYAITTSAPWSGLSYTAVTDLNSSITQGATGGGVNADPNASGHFYAKSASITGLTWNDGDTLYLRFVDGNGSAAWGIDNFSITAIPEPGSLALVGIALGSLLLFRRRKG